MFDKEVFLFDAVFTDREDAISQIADLLASKDVVKSNFKQSVIDREIIFPTGLPTVPVGIAIPHTDAEKVVENQIAIATLKNPVSFRVMGSATDEVDVSLIFLLAIKNAEKHLEILQQLIEVFQSEVLISHIASCKTKHELNLLLQNAGLRAG